MLKPILPPAILALCAAACSQAETPQPGAVPSAHAVSSVASARSGEVAAGATSAREAGARPAPEIKLRAARAERTASAIQEAGGTRDVRGLMLHIDAVLDNPGPPIAMLTNFYSVFDGFALVLCDEAGRELQRVHYTHHQSPMAEDQRLSLARGSTAQTLVFPLTEWTRPGEQLKVRIEGGLRGTPWPRGLVSNEFALAVPAPAP